MRYFPPAPNPCGSCPYRRDVPSGIWDREEYEKLPGYDAETGEQPPSVFACHQQDGKLCAGWCGTHDMAESLGLRLATAMGYVSEEAMRLVLDYETSVPLFTSGEEAAAHGLAEHEAPGNDALREIDKLTRKQAARRQPGAARD